MRFSKADSIVSYIATFVRVSMFTLENVFTKKMNLRIQSSDLDNPSLILTSFAPLEIQILKAWIRRRTSQEPNRMLIKENKGFFSFAFDSAHVKYGV